MMKLYLAMVALSWSLDRSYKINFYFYFYFYFILDFQSFPHHLLLIASRNIVIDSINFSLIYICHSYIFKLCTFILFAYIFAHMKISLKLLLRSFAFFIFYWGNLLLCLIDVVLMTKMWAVSHIPLHCFQSRMFQGMWIGKETSQDI